MQDAVTKGRPPAAGAAGEMASAAVTRPWTDPEAVPFVRIRGVTKTFGPVTAVDEVSLDIYRGELFGLLGGSGSGKTTLLRMLAGFETPTAGAIEIDGQDMTAVPPWERPVNLMFQSYALFPHMSVAKNIGYGLRREGRPRGEIAERVAEMLRLVQLEGYGDRKPHQLSGGQRQRVALARALVKAPKLILLDEPLAALDKKLRGETQFELVRIQESLGITFIVVTHDQEEAMTLSTRIGVMDRGRIVQIGPPQELYERPASRFVADFLGSVNLFEGSLAERTEEGIVVALDAPAARVALAQPIEAEEGTRLWVAIRPEKLRLERTAPAPPVNGLPGTVEEIAYLGNQSIYRVILDGGRRIDVMKANVDRAEEDAVTWDERVFVTFSPRAGVALAG